MVLLLIPLAWRQTMVWRNGETVWTRAVLCAPQSSLAHYCLAAVYAKQGRTDDAIAHCREALTYDVAIRYITVKTHVLLGECLASEGKFDEAAAQYEEALRLNPSLEMGHVSLAMALAAAGKHDRAVAEWKEAIRLAPSFWVARVGLAESLLALGDPGDAAEECREVLSQQPGALKAMLLLAKALVDQGKIEEAIACFRQALTLNPQLAEAHFRLGLTLSSQGQSEEALEQLNEAVRLDPENVSLLWQTAWLLATCPDSSVRDGARAVDLAKKAVDLSKGQDLRSLDALAAALAEAGNFAAAVDVAWQASIAAVSQNQVELSDALAERVRLYRKNLPYHEPPKAADEPGSPADAAPAGAAQ